MALPTHSQILLGLGKEPDKEKLTRLPTHEQIISTQKDEVLEPEIEEPEKTGVFSKLKSFVQKFIPEAVKTAQISDEALKARFKGTYTLLSRQVADAYRGKGIVGKLMSIPTTTFLMPKSYREKQAVKIDKLAKDLQESAFKDMEVVEDYLKKNPLAINMEGVAFTEKMKDPEFVARGLTLNAPTLLASLGISAVVALTTKNPVLAYTAAFGTGFSMEAGEAYNDALKAETTEKEARTVGVIVGSVNGLLESLFPGSKATDLMGGKQIKQQFFKKLTTTVIKDILKEGSTESLQEIVANVGRSVYEDNVDLLRGTEEAAFFGALMGGVTSISTETYQQLKSAGVEVNEEVIKEKEKPAPETQIKEEKVKTKPEVKLENILKPEQVSKAGRIKTSEIENVFNKIPDGTVSPDGYVVKKGNKLFPTEKATPEILENSGISLNKDGSIKEGFALTKTSFTEDVIKPEKIIKPKKEVRTPKEIAKLQDKVIDKKIRTTKDIKGTRDTLKTIRQELDNAVAEAEGRSIVAQEQRAGLDVDDINQLKRIYAINKKFQEGDIETIRASEKVGPLLNRVLENVQEKHPDFSKQEAFDFAIGLPTKADEKVRTSEIIQLEKKEKKLREYIDRLREKQNELKFEESELLEKEWKNVIAAQERLRQLIKVPETQLPVGEGIERVSRLEARVKDALNKITPEEQKDLGLSTYRQMNKEEQIAKASKYVSENTDEALKVLKGDIDPPTGILRNAIYVALKELGSADTQVATQIASLAATRMGQEISILSELDIYSPVSLMEDVVKARIEGYKRKGKNVEKTIKRESGKIKINKPSGKDWNSFLKSIRC